MISEDFLQDYVEEVKEHLQELENSLLVLEREGTNKEEINQIFRAAHSIKGASAYMGLERLASLTHELESLISAIQMQSRPVSAKGISILLRCVDFITHAVRVLQEKGEEPPLPADLLMDLRAVFSADPASEAATSNSPVMGIAAGAQAHEAPCTAIPADKPVALEQSAAEEEVAGTLEVEDEIEGVQFALPVTIPLESVELALEADARAYPASEETSDANDDAIHEEDQELFNIFLTSFQEQYAELTNIIGSAVEVRLTEAEFQNARTLIKRLIASSQYMGYDQLIDVLEAWDQALSAEYQSSASDKQSISKLLQSFSQRLQKNLPQLQLAAVVPSAEPAVEPGELLEEEDEELFAIFLDACQQQYAELVKITPKESQPAISAGDFAKARECIRRMIASSQYMDYEQTTDLLKQWEASLEQAYGEGRATGRLYAEQLFTTGQRLQKLVPGLQLATANTITEDTQPNAEDAQEEDEELFSIFVDSFRQHFTELIRLTPASDQQELPAASFGLARELIAHMISSSRYMDYDPVVNTLGEWDEALSEGQRSGVLDGARYADLLNTYGQRLQHIIAGSIAPSPEVPATEAMALEMLDQEIDASFDEFEKLAIPGEPAAQAPIVTSGQLAPELKPESGMQARGVQDFPSQALDEKTARKPRVATAAEESATAVTLRVDAQKVDQLLNQVGELVVTRSEFIQTAMFFRDMLRELSAQGNLSKQEVRKLRQLSFRLNESTQSLGRVANDLQDSVMRIRMLPISQLFQRFPRVVRDQAFKLGKNVELVVEGGETEIDKRVLEQMNDPIVQFLRNAIVHGIESPRERKLAGKPETGSIRMAAYHEGDYVTLEIEDDGRGIDTAKLRYTLESRREMGAQELDRLSDQELMYAIFLPGISTHDRVDGSAGRGVGLDVVKENVERMSGTIEVESYPGLGTRFTVRIPLTVAIIRALLVKGASQVFTLPLSSVSEILRYKQADTHTIEGFQVITLRGETIPLVHLSRLLNMPAKSCENGHKFIVVVGTSFREVGLVVDGLMGEREVVIKSIEDDFHAFEGFSGATILGDGTVSLIVDLSALLRIRKDALQEPQRGHERYLH
jgi:two-component system, chemotaxis family, sensor kinase CheA